MKSPVAAAVRIVAVSVIVVTAVAVAEVTVTVGSVTIETIVTTGRNPPSPGKDRSRVVLKYSKIPDIVVN